MAVRRLNREDYTVGWICALPIERAVAIAMLDEKHQRLSNAQGDNNSYTYGAINGHNVVIACLPAGKYGTSSATAVAKDMLRSFRIRVGLMVGIGGGVPKNKVRLGDVVVSNPSGHYGGVVQYDFGKAMAEGVLRQNGHLNSPPTVLLTALAELRAQHEMFGNQSHVHISKMVESFPQMKEEYAFSDRMEDVLFRAEDIHPEGNEDCEPCKSLFQQVQRKDAKPEIHYGLIASGNQVMKDGKKRDQIDQNAGDKVLCFEMEAAGLMDDFPCLVIRGICDYSDSHKNKGWQRYAAAAAAAYTKDFLGFIALEELLNTPIAAVDYRVPFDLKGMPVIDHFVGREAELQVLEKALLPQSYTKQRKIFFLSGLGGMGKTQLAVKFARENKENYDSIFWLDGRTETSLLQSIAAIAPRIPSGQCDERYKSLGSTKVTVEEVSDHVIQWLCSPDNTRWLLIFDNVDHDPREPQPGNESYDFRKYFPSADQGIILVTTRLKHLGKGYHLLQLQERDSLELLQSKAQKSIAESSSLDNLLKKLDGLPLALAQAGAYIMQTGCSIVEYSNSYEQNWKELKEAEDHPKLLLDDYPKSVINTWSISYHQINQIDKAAVFLLKIWAVLDNSDLWYELFTPALKLKDPRLPSWFRKRIESSISFRTVVSTLLNYSLVQPKGTGDDQVTSYYMHPVVHSWLYRSVLQDLETNRIEFEMLALHLIGSAVPPAEKSYYWVVGRRLLPHANHWYQLYQDGSYSGYESSAEIQHEIYVLGSLFSDLGHMKEAETLLLRALEGFDKVLGAEHEATLDTINKLGILYWDLRRIDEAEAMYKRAIEGYEKVLGEEHTSTLKTVNNLGILYRVVGRMEESGTLFKRALEGCEKAIGPESPLTLQIANNVGIFYWNIGRMKEAEVMIRRALDGYEKSSGADHTSTLRTVDNIGLLYRYLGRMEEAEVMTRRALEGYEKALGAEHNSTLNTVHNLGALYRDLGRIEEAETMYQRALEGREKSLGAEHASTLETVNYFGVLYWDQGRMKEAEAMLQRALVGYEKALGAEHTDTLEAVNNLGNLYRDLGRIKEAEAMYQRALQGYEKALGAEHTSTLQTVDDYGILYRNLGRMEEAEAMFRRALEGYEKVRGIEDKKTIDIAKRLKDLQEQRARSANGAQLSNIGRHRPSKKQKISR